MAARSPRLAVAAALAVLAAAAAGLLLLRAPPAPAPAPADAGTSADAAAPTAAGPADAALHPISLDETKPTHRFVALFVALFGAQGTVDDDGLAKLRTALADIPLGDDAQLATRLMWLVEYDREMDIDEMGAVKEGLYRLLGAKPGDVFEPIDRALQNAVPYCNLKIGRYDLSFDLTGDGPEYPARLALTLANPAPKQAVLEAFEDRLTIESVQADGKAAEFGTQDHRLIVEAPGATRFDIAFKVKALPPGKRALDDRGLVRDGKTGRLWTALWPAGSGSLFPSNGNPIARAPFRVRLALPPGMGAVASGDREADAFVSDFEVPAYAIGFVAYKGAAPLADTTTSGFAVRALGADAKKTLALARAATDTFSRWLGPLEVANSLTLVELPQDGRPMPFAGFTAVPTGADAKARGDVQLAQAVAAQWFGVRMSPGGWHERWMTEGFATYLALRFLETRDGEQAARKAWAEALKRVDEALARSVVPLVPRYVPDPRMLEDAVPAEGGAWLLRMLEQRLGRDVFDRLLSAWARDHRGLSVATTDFFKYVREQTGRDEGSYFNGWMAVKAVPKVVASVERLGPLELGVRLEPATPVPGEVTVPIHFETTKGRDVAQVEPGAQVEVRAQSPITRYRFDPDQTLMLEVEEPRPR